MEKCHKEAFLYYNSNNRQNNSLNTRMETKTIKLAICNCNCLSNFVVRLILKSVDKWKNIPYNKNTFKKFLNQIIFFYKNSNNNNP